MENKTQTAAAFLLGGIVLVSAVILVRNLPPTTNPPISKQNPVYGMFDLSTVANTDTLDGFEISNPSDEPASEPFNLQQKRRIRSLHTEFLPIVPICSEIYWGQAMSNDNPDEIFKFWFGLGENWPDRVSTKAGGKELEGVNAVALIEAHTDRVDNESFNYVLSLNRALAVASLLRDAGFQGQVCIEGYGENGIASGSVDGKANQNFRVATAKIFL